MSAGSDHRGALLGPCVRVGPASGAKARFPNRRFVIRHTQQVQLQLMIIDARHPVSPHLPATSRAPITELPVVPNLASPDEYAVVGSGVKVHAKEGVGHVTSCPGPPNIAAKIKSSPTRLVDGR